MSPFFAFEMFSDVEISLASGILGMEGVCIVLALVREGEAGAEFGDSSLVKLREMCNALGLLASVGVGFDMVHERECVKGCEK
jgi:hypothetical protein